MVEARFGNEYLSIRTTKDGDVVEIMGEGSYGSILNKWTKQQKEVLNIPVQCNGRNYIYTPTSRHGLILIEVWGKNTTNWINKKFQVFHIDGKMHVKPI